MNQILRCCSLALAVVLVALALPAGAQQKKPNIVVIMGDDIGIWNIGAYHRGMMAGPDAEPRQARRRGHAVHRLLRRGELHGGTRRLHHRRAADPHRHDHRRPGRRDRSACRRRRRRSRRCSSRWVTPPASSARTTSATSTSSCPPSTASTSSSATSITSTRWRIPCHPDYPQELLDKVGPRNMVHSLGDRQGRRDRDPRWGKVGKQKIEDAGTLYPKRMETVDDEIRDLAFKFIDKAKADGKPFFLWLNPTRMHIVTHLSPKYEALRNSKNGWTIHEAGMAQLDDIVGARDAEAQGHGRGRQHHRRVHHRQRHRGLHLAGRRPDAVRAGQGHGHGRRLPRAGDDPLAGQGPGGQGRERHHLRTRLVPDASSPPPATRTSRRSC